MFFVAAEKSVNGRRFTQKKAAELEGSAADVGLKSVV
jgi:hypothetical protein